MPKKKYMRPRQRLVAQLDDITGQIVKWRDGRQCYCQSRVVPQWGHLIGRSNYALRWHLLNGHVQCSSCNMAHSNPGLTYRYANWFIRRFGRSAYAQLMELADTRTATEWTTEQLKEELEMKQALLALTKTATVYDDEWLYKKGFWGTDIELSLPLGPQHYSWRNMV